MCEVTQCLSHSSHLCDGQPESSAHLVGVELLVGCKEWEDLVARDRRKHLRQLIELQHVLTYYCHVS